MATLRTYRDGGFYIHRGYPVRCGQRDEDMFHTTIQVLPRADAFFDIPSETLYIAEGLADSEGVMEFMREPQILACRHLREYYRVIRQLRPANADPSLTAYICLARHLRQAAYDREQQRKFS